MFDLTLRAQDYLNFMLLVSSYYVIGQAMNTLTIAGIFPVRADLRYHRHVGDFGASRLFQRVCTAPAAESCILYPLSG